VPGRIAGGLRLPHDETGDCHLYTVALARLAQGLGVRFLYGQAVTRLAERGNRVSGVQLESGPHLSADCYVLALASYTRALVQPLGLDLPLYPVKGYSLTLPLLDAQRAPRSTVLDETYKVAITRLERRLRVGGMAELAGDDLRLRPTRRATLEKVVQELFPGGDLAAAEFWAGLRPMTPDSTPIVGGTPIPNLYLNTGHGTLGWTMAAGSGQLLADLILGRPPAIRVDGLAMDRYFQAARRRTLPARGLRA
jgi:D-amino-acid dehydrogenase